MSPALLNPSLFAPSGPSAYVAAVLADSPLAYWRLGEASGTTATDASGNGRHATYTNGPTLGAAGLLTGDPDTAMSTGFQSGQCASIASAAWMNVSAITVELLLKPTSYDITNGGALVSRYGSGGFPWVLVINGSDGKLMVQINAGTNVKAPSAIVAGTRYHLAFTFASGVATLYLNGTAVNSASGLGSLAATTMPIEIGRYSSANGTVPNCVFDEVAIYGSALSGARIAAHAAAV